MKKDDFQDLICSVKQAAKIKKGKLKANRVFEFKPADVKQIRNKAGKSQAEFALMIGVSVGTLRNWEQGRRVPEGPAQALLKIVEAMPEEVAKVLSA